MKDYKHIEHMRNLNDNLIWERMERCYDYGYKDGKADTSFTDTKDAEEKAYNRGLSDVWDAVRKIIEPADDGGYGFNALQTIFGESSIRSILKHNTAIEAIDKIKAYEKQDAEIKVGYEVYNIDRENKRIVTAIDGNKAIQLCSNGKYTVDNIETLHWTGREDLRIKNVLENITNEV